MESKYDVEKVRFYRLEEICKASGMSRRELSLRAGMKECGVSMMVKGKYVPMTDTVARLCSILGCSVRDIMEFRGIEVRDMFREPRGFEVPDVFSGVTYAPLRLLIREFYDGRDEGKDIQDFFDILPRTHQKNPAVADAYREHVRKALEARGLSGEMGNPKRKNYTKGLRYETRNKIMHDRPVRIATVYDICSALGCTPDYVMAYK